MDVQTIFDRNTGHSEIDIMSSATNKPRGTRYKYQNFLVRGKGVESSCRQRASALNLFEVVMPEKQIYKWRDVLEYSRVLSGDQDLKSATCRTYIGYVANQLIIEDKIEQDVYGTAKLEFAKAEAKRIAEKFNDSEDRAPLFSWTALSELPKMQRDLLMFHILTGMRRSSLAFLTREHIDGQILTVFKEKKVKHEPTKLFMPCTCGFHVNDDIEPAKGQECVYCDILPVVRLKIDPRFHETILEKVGGSTHSPRRLVSSKASFP